MNPGPVEEGGKVASGVVDALKTQPLSLALIVLNVIFLLVGYFMIIKIADLAAAERARQDVLLADLARNCVVPSDTKPR